MKVTRPLMRYHGGKWKLADWIMGYFPKHRTYVEPFGGGGSVLLRKARSYAEVYNDIDEEVVNVFRVARDHGEQLGELLKLTPFARDEFDQAYEPTDDPIERARRTIIRSFMGFGSNAIHQTTGFRSNSNRSGTTPAHDWRNYGDLFPMFIDRLRGVIIENRDARAIMLTHDGEQTLHYVDPPYVMSTRKDGYADYGHEMNDADHEALGDFIKGLQGQIVLSGYDCELYRDMFPGWTVRRRASRADGAAKRVECLWLSPNIPTNELF